MTTQLVRNPRSHARKRTQRRRAASNAKAPLLLDFPSEEILRLRAQTRALLNGPDKTAERLGDFDAQPVAFALFDEHGSVHAVNRRLENMLGYPARYLRAGNFTRFLAPGEVAAFLHHLRRARNQEITITYDLFLTTKRSHRLPVELITSRFFDHNNRPWFRTCIIDTTERRLNSARAAQTRYRYQTLLNTIEGIVWEAQGPELDVTFVSGFAQKLLGYPSRNWFAPGFWENHIHVDDRDRVMHTVSKALAEASNFVVDYRVFTANRRILWLHDSVSVQHESAILEREGASLEREGASLEREGASLEREGASLQHGRGGGKLRLLGIAVDITEQKENERKLQATQGYLESSVAQRTAELRETVTDLEAFSYSMSHDLRAPLRAIQGYSELLQQSLADLLDPTQNDFFDRIKNSTTRMDTLIQDVLTYSRVARAPLELQPVDVERVVRDVIRDYPGLQRPRAEIEIEKPLAPVKGHPAFLSQCVSNLLWNAVKFVPHGRKPRVRVRTIPAHSDVEIWFEDNGIGIAPEHQKRIFGIFQRLNPDKAYEGTGIGLAIVQKAVERMGGRVGVESQLGQGSRFWLRLHSAE
jgi:PAS domain S-box-containing protein